MMLAVVRAIVEGIRKATLCRTFDPSSPPLLPKTTLSWRGGERRSERRCFLIDSPNRRQNLLFILAHSVWRNEFGNTYVIHVAIAIAASRHNSSSRLFVFFSARTPRSDGPVSPVAPPTRVGNHPQHEKNGCVTRKL